MCWLADVVLSFLIFQLLINSLNRLTGFGSRGMSLILGGLLHAERKSFVASDVPVGKMKLPSRTCETSGPSPCCPSKSMKSCCRSWLPPSVWWYFASLTWHNISSISFWSVYCCICPFSCVTCIWLVAPAWSFCSTALIVPKSFWMASFSFSCLSGQISCFFFSFG